MSLPPQILGSYEMAPIKIVCSQLMRGQTIICLLLSSLQYLNTTFSKELLLPLSQAWSNALGWTTLPSWGPLARKWWETPASLLDLLSSPCVPSWAQWQWQSWLEQERAAGTQVPPTRRWHCRTGVVAADQRKYLMLGAVKSFHSSKMLMTNRRKARHFHKSTAVKK